MNLSEIKLPYNEMLSSLQGTEGFDDFGKFVNDRWDADCDSVKAEIKALYELKGAGILTKITSQGQSEPEGFFRVPGVATEGLIEVAYLNYEPSTDLAEKIKRICETKQEQHKKSRGLSKIYYFVVGSAPTDIANLDLDRISGYLRDNELLVVNVIWDEVELKKYVFKNILVKLNLTNKYFKPQSLHLHSGNFNKLPKSILSDFSRVLLKPKDPNYIGSLNALHKDLVAKQGDNYNMFSYFELNTQLLDFYRSLKGRFPLYLFTSDIIQNHGQIRPILDSIFDRIFSAKDYNLVKSDSLAYTRIAAILGVVPLTIVFIDDQLTNVVAAKKAGLTTFHYQDDNHKTMTDIQRLLKISVQQK